MGALPVDRPKLLGDPAACAARKAQLYEPHVAQLTSFVESLRAKMGPHAHIPYFDPWDGGVGAELLYLLEAPGPRAVGSAFISRNNPDESAKNFFELNVSAEIARQRTVTWNVVPWYIGTGVKIRAATQADIDAGISSLSDLFALLPHLRAVVLMGRKAQRAASLIRHLRPNQVLLQAPHPSPMFINRAKGNADVISAVLKEAAKILAMTNGSA
jgi:uracil-DNA glycosylase